MPKRKKWSVGRGGLFRIEQRLLEHVCAIGAVHAHPVALRCPLKPVVRYFGAVDDVGCKGGAESGLEEIKQIALVASACVCVDNESGVHVHARCQLEAIDDSLVVVEVFGSDPGGLKGCGPVFPVPVEIPADMRRPVGDIGGFVDFSFMGHHVVMKDLTRAVSEASTVGQHDESFAVLPGPFLQLAHVVDVPLSVSLDAVGIEILC